VLLMGALCARGPLWVKQSGWNCLGRLPQDPRACCGWFIEGRKSLKTGWVATSSVRRSGDVDTWVTLYPFWVDGRETDHWQPKPVR
jgi:hypothetical protein